MNNSPADESLSLPSAKPRSKPGFPVVGIGASAGGIAALQRFFEHMPSQTGMAFVVVVHLSPNHESSLDKILQKLTRMPVAQVTQPVNIEADHIYLIPPSRGLSMADGYLRLTDPQRVDGKNVQIDLFFRSLADAHQERAFCVVLSGSGSDGTQGLGRVKEMGGVTLAQDPVDAEFDSMPRSAIATGMVDIVLPAADMPNMLAELWRNASRIELPDAPADVNVMPGEPDARPQAEDALHAVMRLLRERTGHDFTQYKRATVLRRIERRMQVNMLPTLPAYLQFLDAHAEETQALLQDMLISVTHFFRDRDAFEALERELGAMHAARPPEEPMRAWVAGCATGEEAYSVAMLLCDEFIHDVPPPSIQVFASDIDQRAINFARLGVYPESIVTDVPPSRLRRHFTREDLRAESGYRISRTVRDKVTFSTHNVLRDPPFTKVDLICCRNLLIYLDRGAQLQVLQTFHFALKPGGLLLLGNAESGDAVDELFTVIDKKQRLFRAQVLAKTRRTEVPRAVIGMPTVMPGIPALVRVARPPLEELHRRLNEQFGVPSVLIDGTESIVHVDERAAHLLRHVGGPPSTKLLTLVLPELRPALRAALQLAAKAGTSVEAPRVAVQRNTGTRHVHMSVRPIDSGESGLSSRHMLVTFDELDATLEPDDANRRAGRDPLVLALEAELQRAQDELTNRAAQSATTTEDLRASNEELQAVNEELRSTTEELETSAEELQSVNEELITVNGELRAGIDETAKLNDDLRNLIASTDIAIVFLDRSLRIKRFTPRAARLFNLIDTDVGRPLLDITHRLDYDLLSDDLAQILHSLQHTEREVRSDDGRWYLARVVPYRTAEDRIDGVVLNFIDVTGRHEAEFRLHATERYMRVVAQSTHDFAITTTDLEGRVTSWTAGAERIFGYTADEMMGRNIELLYPMSDRTADVPRQEMREAFETGRSDSDRWLVRKDGSTFYCSGVTTKLQDDTLQGFARIARDLTQNKVLETRRKVMFDAEKATRMRLEEVNNMKDEFLAVMSHELKNPLNLIQLNADLLLRTPEGRGVPAIVRAATTIRRAVASQVQIIDDLLDLSRLNTGKLRLARGPVDLRTVIERIATAIDGDATTKGLNVRMHLSGELSVHADAVRVEQIIWNLVNNALKFTPPGGSIDIGAETDQGHARVFVKDSGIGMDPKLVPHVFEMFRQADLGAAREKGGLGVGLALVKRLSELHGGHAEAASEGLGLGCCFSVWLPLHDATQDAPEPERVPGDLTGLRILLVDDESDSLSAFSQLLGIAGAKVTPVRTAEAALTWVQQTKFDLVVSDIAMPGVDGHTLIARLRELPESRHVPAVAVTGRATAADRARAMRAGFDAHLGKPIDLEMLIEQVQRLVTDRGDLRLEQGDSPPP